MRNNSNFSVIPGGVSIDILKAVKKALAKLGLVRRPKKAVEEYFNPIEKELEKVEATSHEILYKTKTVFPFDLFPDVVIIDREKLTLIQRFFFFVEKVISIPIRDILNVEANTGPFLGSVRTASRYFITTPLSIKYLWRKDALRMQRLLQGYIIANERSIDCTSVSKTHLIELLEHLGQGEVKQPT